MKCRLYPTLVLALGIFRVAAQDMPARLTVDEAVAAALSNNRNLKIAVLDEKTADARYKETEAIYLPQAGVSYSVISTNNPLNAFGFKLEQKSISAADFDPARLNHPDGTPDFMTSLEVQQPLINMDMVYQRKGAYLQKEIYRLKGQRVKEEVEFEVRKAYMQLQLAYRVQQVVEDALGTANALYRWTNDRVDQGMLSKADALNIQVKVKTMESRLAEAKSRVMDASDVLGLLMGRTPGPAYAVDSAGDRDVLAATADSMLPEDRADLSAFRKSIQATDLMIRSSKMSALPRLNAFGSYQLNDSRMFGFGAGGYLAGVRLSWDIFKGNSIRNRSATMTLEKNKLSEQYTMYKEQSQVELNATFRKLSDTEFRIIQQQAAVASAGESYRILRDRYEQGLSGSTDVLLAQTQVSQQRLALAQAIFDRDVTKAYIELLTSSSGK
ncbi:MAG TPA: TolC family protein [Puia sp.]|nr:TolC family protein [Puia sp.]